MPILICRYWQSDNALRHAKGFATSFLGFVLNQTNPDNDPVDYRYLVRSKHDLVHYYSRNLATKGYVFYSSFFIPADKDAELVDAKIILLYRINIHKQMAYRERKNGMASIKYVRSGRVGYLFATHGRSDFFTREGNIRCIYEAPFCLEGYSISANRETGEVRVRLHREVRKRLKLFVLEWARKREDPEWWIRWFDGLFFAQYSGVRDNLMSLLKLLNSERRRGKLKVIEPQAVLGKKIPATSKLLQESSKELLDLLAFMSQ